MLATSQGENTAATAAPAGPVDAPALDFVVIGAAKAGTTALFHLIGTHPELHLPDDKELPFFVASDHAYYGSPAEFFADVFRDRRPGQLCGTATPQYLYGALPKRQAEAMPERSERAETIIPSRIHSAYPDAKLIAILRDPVARARSHHRIATIRGHEQRSFDRAIEELLRPEALAGSRAAPDVSNAYVVLGEYGRLLQGFADVFPREQLLVVFQDELARDPAAVCATVFAFLGVDPGFRPPNLGRRYNEGSNRRRRFAWLELRAWQRAAERSKALRGLWRRLPRSLRLGVLKRFDLAVWRLFLWNRVPADAQATPDPPAPETLTRLREHYREDGSRLRALLGAAPPWEEPRGEGGTPTGS